MAVTYKRIVDKAAFEHYQVIETTQNLLMENRSVLKVAINLEHNPRTQEVKCLMYLAPVSDVWAGTVQMVTILQNQF